MSRRANSYPLKGIVDENRTRAIPPNQSLARASSPFLVCRDKGTDEQGPRGYDVDKGRDGIGDYRLRDYNELERFGANDFPHTRGVIGRGRAEEDVKETEERRATVRLQAIGKEEWFVIGSKEDTY